MTKVYQCDRCKTIFEPRVLVHGEPYIARKGKADLDLCPNCYNMFTDFINAIKNGIPYESVASMPMKDEKVLQSLCDTCRKYDECSDSTKISPNFYLIDCKKYEESDEE